MDLGLAGSSLASLRAGTHTSTPPGTASTLNSHGSGRGLGSTLRPGLLGTAVVFCTDADDPQCPHCGTEEGVSGREVVEEYLTGRLEGRV